MRTDVLRQGRLRLARSAGMLALAALAAGCSADATRLQDSFYTGAIPPAPIQSQQVASAQPTYGAGQPNASYGAGTTGASQTYAVATPSVSRSSLPPPPAASYSGGTASYGQPSAPGSVSSPVGSAEVSRTEAARAMPSAAAATSTSGGSYVVTSGDSVLGIARRHGVRAADLRNANGLSDDNIKIGQKLVIPGGSGTPAQPARYASLGAPPTTLQAQAANIPAPRAAPSASRPAPVAQTTAPKPVVAAPAATAQTTPAPVVAAAPASQPPVKAPTAPAAPTASESVVATAAPATTVAAEEKQEQAALAPASTGISQFRWPVQGRVIKNFGDKVGSRRNDGLNISVPRGTPVKAAENGVVIYAGEGLKEFGKTVLVKHDNGLVTVYGHADDIKVQRGATVKRGEEIATAGMTGDAEAPMLHFEVRKDSSPVNPMTYLR